MTTRTKRIRRDKEKYEGAIGNERGGREGTEGKGEERKKRWEEKVKQRIGR